MKFVPMTARMNCTPYQNYMSHSKDQYPSAYAW